MEKLIGSNLRRYTRKMNHVLDSRPDRIIFTHLGFEAVNQRSVDEKTESNFAEDS
jgi:hypothetical protein